MSGPAHGCFDIGMVGNAQQCNNSSLVGIVLGRMNVELLILQQFGVCIGGVFVSTEYEALMYTGMKKQNYSPPLLPSFQKRITNQYKN